MSDDTAPLFGNVQLPGNPVDKAQDERLGDVIRTIAARDPRFSGAVTMDVGAALSEIEHLLATTPEGYEGRVIELAVQVLEQPHLALPMGDRVRALRASAAAWLNLESEGSNNRAVVHLTEAWHYATASDEVDLALAMQVGADFVLAYELHAPTSAESTLQRMQQLLNESWHVDPVIYGAAAEIYARCRQDFANRHRPD